MKVTLPWLRQASTKTRSNSYPHESYFRIDREFEFKEFSATEAPVAFKWADTEIRTMEDRLWRRVFARREAYSQRFSASVDGLLSKDVILDALKRNEGFRFMTDSYINIDKSRLDKHPASHYKYFEWTDKPLEQIGIDTWHSDVVLIGDQFWIACPCPSYSVDGERVIPVTVAFPKLTGTGLYECNDDKLGDVSRSRRPFDHRGDANALSLHFGVDELEHAVAIARSGAFKAGYRDVEDDWDNEDDNGISHKPVRIQTTEIETIMPQCVVPPALAVAAMAEAFSSFMSAVSYKNGHGKPIRQFDAHALRGVACIQEVAFDKKAEDIDTDELADAVEACLAHLSQSSSDVPAPLRLLLTTCIARTRNRAVDLSFS
ncbi:hypothetical protein [Rhizobium sp. BK176]|uniref:hypothetical protein n=1 Tax=Rhizobium sp. BK176 TaxID=2587071 RepID=UPI002168F888|nr:hypothetical protein [Rhizobium sp. BK176]MCS4089674.1 hypothetical protein [Rhizobium sp. BK176]